MAVPMGSLSVLGIGILWGRSGQLCEACPVPIERCGQLLVQEAGNSVANELGICWLVVILVSRYHPDGEEPFVPRRQLLETGGEELGSLWLSQGRH